jgi:acetylornithine deacetylase/succinyl-diaminopimelate desuccinylase-like protein
VNNQVIKSFVESMWDNSIISTLSHYISIPNKSPAYDPHWEKQGYMDEAVAIMAAWCQANAPVGMHLEVLRVPGRTPLIYIEVPGQSDETILFYGHCDKQPEMTGWHPELGPWKPVIQGDKLYGRGGADDGYAIFSSVTAILALQAQNIPHARCVILIEASEESGSVDLPFYLEMLNDRIGKPSLLICLDSGAGNYEQMWMTTSLRGNFVGELQVSLLKEGVHSGVGSGVVADSFRVARELLSRIEDEKTGEILLKELHVDIPPARIKEARQCAEALGEQIYAELPFQEGVRPVLEDTTELLLNRTWRPALSITGAGGLPPLENAGNVSRPTTSLKLSMRLAPTCDFTVAQDAIKKALETNPPYHAKVQFHSDRTMGKGWNAPATAPWLEAACQEASQAFYGKPSVCHGEGGTIPFINMVGEKFPESQFVITGVLGPASNAHGPNEFLHIPMAKKLTACMAMIVARQYEKK